MLRAIFITVCLASSAPVALYAQTEPEEDGTVDLKAIDSLFGNQIATGDEDMDGDAAAEDATIATGGGEVAGTEAAEDDVSEEEEPPEPSDLTLAFNAYSLCASQAGAVLEETGFALDVIGEEALLRCSGQRAAYVNALYFRLLPRNPDAPEATVRTRAERLTAQSDAALGALVTDDVTALRAEREAEAGTGPDADDAEPSDADSPDNTDGETAEDEMEPDA